MSSQENTRRSVATAIHYSKGALGVHPSHSQYVADKLADHVNVCPDGSIAGTTGGNLEDVIASLKATDDGFARLFSDYNSHLPKTSKLSSKDLARLSPDELLAFANKQARQNG